MPARPRKKISARQAQAIKTKNKIYKTAYEMMEKKGFDNITIEDISKKAGVSVGSFYYYFRSKNDILYEIFHRADEYFKENVEGKFKSEHAVERIVEFFSHYARYSASTSIEFTKQLYSTDNKFFNNKERDMCRILEDIITRGQEAGEIEAGRTATEIANELFITARGLVFDWCLHDGDYDLELASVRQFERIAPAFAKR